FGSMNQKELTFTDNFLIASYRQMAYGIAGGAVFNLANMLLVGAITVAGMAVAFPLAIGLALVIGVVWNFALNPQGNAMLLFGGAVLIVAAMVVDAVAYSGHMATQTARTKSGREINPLSKVRVRPWGALR